MAERVQSLKGRVHSRYLFFLLPTPKFGLCRGFLKRRIRGVTATILIDLETKKDDIYSST